MWKAKSAKTKCPSSAICNLLDYMGCLLHVRHIKILKQKNCTNYFQQFTAICHFLMEGHNTSVFRKYM